MMKVVNLPILLITSVFLVACSNAQTTQGVEGLDTPMEIEGISIIFSGAEFYSVPYNMIQPTSSGDILLLVKGEVLSGDAEKLGNWGVIYGEEYPRVVNQVTTFTSADIIEHKFT